MKKKGFTLIELLAVIIVLAIIALIATPIIFNVIENAKLKSLENSCYGIIDTVRTNYAENLLNSTDGQVKLKGSVTELTVAGEQPIQGTWEIDNTVDSNDRGIKIKDVKFASMKDYTCTNVNSDGTINSKVMCTKSGDDETDLSDFTITEIYDFEMDMDACISKYEGTNTEGLDGYEASHEEAVDICNNNRPISGFFYIDEYLYMMSGDATKLKELIDSGMIKLKINYSIDFDGCVSYFLGDDIDEDIPDEDVEYMKSVCRNEVEFEQGKTIKEALDELISTNDITTISELENGGLIKINNKLKLITGYNGTDKNIVIPKEVTAILGNTYFGGKDIESVDFSKAKNLTTIGYGAFENNKISSLDLTGATKLKTIGVSAFNNNQINDIKFSSSIKSIGNTAFTSNQLTNLIIPDNIESINDFAFSYNQLTNIKLSNKMKTLSNGVFSDNYLTNIEIPNNIETIVYDAFSYNKLESVTIPNSVKKIDNTAFSYNENLKTITIDNTKDAITGSPWGATNATITWKRS